MPILDPASLQVNRRTLRVKTDGLDVLMLVRALVAVDRGDRHVCSIVRVRTIEEEDARRSHRERHRLIRERSAHINRIKALFFGQGIRGIEPLRKRSHVNLSEIWTAEGVPSPARLHAEIEREYSRFDHIEERLKAIEAERDTADAQEPAVNEKRETLIRLRGLGPTSAGILAREVFGRSFANRKQLGSYLGLTLSVQRAPL